MLITQLSDEDSTAVEIRMGGVTMVVASMYFDIKRPIEEDLQKIQATLKNTRGTATIFAIDSNARSTSRNHVLTNERGRAMEEFITTNQLHIVNEKSYYSTFQTSQGASNIDLTIFNDVAIKLVQEWAVHDGESCSEHNIIQFTLG